MVILIFCIIVENGVENFVEMDLGKNFILIICIIVKNEILIILEIDIDDKLDLENVNCGNEEVFFIVGEVEYEVLDFEKIFFLEEMLLKDKEVFNKFIDL